MQFEELTAGHGALTAVRTGQGPDLVLLHSLLADRHSFDPILPALAEKFRVTLINLPGYHGSHPPLLALADTYVAIIEDGFDEFGIARDSVLLGNGFGGTITLAFGLAHPERISKLVLSNASASYPPEGRQGYAMMADKAARGGLEAVAEIIAKRMLSPDYAKAHPEAIEDRQQALLGIHPEAFQAACRVLQETDLVPLLSHLRVPTLVVCGGLDQVTPPALSREIAHRATNAAYVELPGCGHCPPLEQPDAFLRAVRDFIGL